MADTTDRAADFDVVLRGYDRAQVDARMAEIEEELDRIRGELADGAAEGLAIGIDDGEALVAELSAIGREVSEILEAARAAAEGMRTRASSDAAVWREEARSESESSLNEATEQSQSLRASAWNEGSSLLASAAAEAQAIVAQAKEDALFVRAEAEREAIRLTGDAKRDREELLRAARSEAEQTVEQARIESDAVLAAAAQQAELAQERARALEDRRSELLSELEATRASIGDLEAEIESRRQELESPPEPEVVEPPEGNRSHHASDGGSVRIVSPTRAVELEPVDADQLMAEVEALRSGDVQPVVPAVGVSEEPPPPARPPVGESPVAEAAIAEAPVGEPPPAEPPADPSVADTVEIDAPATAAAADVDTELTETEIFAAEQPTVELEPVAAAEPTGESAPSPIPQPSTVPETMPEPEEPSEPGSVASPPALAPETPAHDEVPAVEALDEIATSGDEDVLGSLFARLREESSDSDEPASSPQDEESSPAVESGSDDEGPGESPASDLEPVAEDDGAGEEGARDAAAPLETAELETAEADTADEDPAGGDEANAVDTPTIAIQNEALRSIKRTLVELQNETLEHLRTDPEWEPEEAYTDRFGEAFASLSTEVWGTGDPAAADAFAADLFDALQSAIERSRSSGGGDRAVAAAASKIFRMWRSDEAERRVVQVTATEPISA